MLAKNGVNNYRLAAILFWFKEVISFLLNFIVCVEKWDIFNYCSLQIIVFSIKLFLKFYFCPWFLNLIWYGHVSFFFFLQLSLKLVDLLVSVWKILTLFLLKYCFYHFIASLLGLQLHIFQTLSSRLRESRYFILFFF